MSFLSAVGGFTPIDATGGTETTVTSNGFDFIQHEFTGNSNYAFTVNDLGDDDAYTGLVQYEIVGDGQGPNANAQLNGGKMRRIDPFFDNNTIFEHTSKTTSFTQSSETVDTTLNAESEVNGACRSETWQNAVNQQYADDRGRMPTFEEYLSDCTAGSGCGHDFEECWTASKGTTDNEHWTTKGYATRENTSTLPRIQPDGNTHELRQVTDQDLSRPDPVILQDDYILSRVQAENYPHTIVAGPTVQVQSYDLTLGQGSISDKIEHSGKQVGGSSCGDQNFGTVVVRYPAEQVP